MIYYITTIVVIAYPVFCFIALSIRFLLTLPKAEGKGYPVWSW